MKKFEDKFNENISLIKTALGDVCSVTLVKAVFKNWISPEDHQNTVASNKAYEKSNRTLSEENAKFVVENIELQKQIAELKSQLKKQKPEIPEFMAKAVEEFKKQPDSYKGFSKVNEVWSWLNEYQMNNDDFGICGLNNKFFVLAHFAINGYTVAKEKRFYLKNKLTGLYLYESKKGFFEQEKLALELTSRCDYTQQEINSMETGSYEQIEVEE